jgi:hypothetical protein
MHFWMLDFTCWCLLPVTGMQALRALHAEHGLIHPGVMPPAGAAHNFGQKHVQ